MSEPTKRAHAEMELGLDPLSAPPLLQCADGTMPCPSELLEISYPNFISSCMECDDFNGTVNVSKYTKEEVMDFIQLYLCSERKHRKTNTDDAHILRLCRAAWVGMYLNIHFSWRPLASVCTSVGLIEGHNNSPVVRAFMALFTHECTWRSFLARVDSLAIRQWISNEYAMNDLSVCFLTSKVTDFLSIPSDASGWFPDKVYFRERVQQSPAIHFLSLILGKPGIVPTKKPTRWLQKLLYEWIHDFIAVGDDSTAVDVRDFFDTDKWSIDPALRDSFIQFVLEHTLQLKKEQEADMKAIQELVKNVERFEYMDMKQPKVLHQLTHFKIALVPEGPYQLPETFSHQGKKLKWKEVIELHEAELKAEYKLHSIISPIQGIHLLRLVSKQMTVLELLAHLRCEITDLTPVIRYLKQHDRLQQCLIEKHGIYQDYRGDVVMHDDFHPDKPPLRFRM
jgi:hypothetical protein